MGPGLRTASDAEAEPPTSGQAHTGAVSDKRLAWLVGVPIAIVFADYVRFYGRAPVDDSFIFMRIARMWNDTGAPYFNHGEAVMGHSSHLWLWIVTAVFRVFGLRADILVGVSAVLYGACFALGAVLLTRRGAKPLVATGLSATIVLLYLLPSSADMLETPLAIGVALAALLLTGTGRDALLGFVVGLCLLSRYELGLLVPLCFLASRRRLAFLAGLAPPATAFLIFTLHYFGTPFPNTAAAKLRVYSGGRKLLLSFINWPEVNRNSVAHGVAVACFVSLTGLLLAYGIRGWRRDDSRWLLIATLLSSTMLGVTYAIDGLMFRWYWPIATVPLMFAACAIAIKDWRQSYVPLGLAATLGPLTLGGWGCAAGYALRDPTRHFEHESSVRAEQYQEIGRALKQAKPEGTLLATEIGAVGWEYYPNEIIDAIGLVTPGVLKYHPMKIPEQRQTGLLGCVPPDAVRDLQPDYVVSMNIYSDAFRRAVNDGSLQAYRLVAQWPVLDRDIARGTAPGTEVALSRSIDLYVRSEGSLR